MEASAANADPAVAEARSDASPPRSAVPVCSDDSELNLCGRMVKYSKERLGWYLYDAGNSAFGGLAVVVFIPILLVNLAKEFSLNGGQISSCDSLEGVSCTGGQCAQGGAPFAGQDCAVCVVGSGSHLWDSTALVLRDFKFPKVPFLGSSVDPVSYASMIISVSVVFQAVFLISAGPFADFGAYRKTGLVAASLIGQLCTLLFIFTNKGEMYQLAGILTIVANSFFGMGVVFYNAYLPILVDAHPRLVDCPGDSIPEGPLLDFREKEQNRMSTVGFMTGYFSTLFVAIFCFSLQLIVTNEGNRYLADRLSIFFPGIVWFVATLFSWRWLKTRAGPPLPITNVVHTLGLGWRELFATLREAKQYKNTFTFLLTYFLYSDTVSTIVSVGALFAQDELCMSTAELAAMLVLVSIFAFLGNYLYLYVHMHWGVSSKSIIMTNLAWYGMICLWGIIGLIPGIKFGFRQKWEVFCFVIINGLNLGAVQSFTRAVYSDLTLPGRESQFFSLYEITDKGSSWIGPLVVALIRNSTGSLRQAFIYLLATVVLSLLMLWYLVDVRQGMIDVGRVGEPGEKGLEQALDELAGTEPDQDQDKNYENDNLLATAGDRKRAASPKGDVRADTYSSSDPLPYTSSEALLPPLVENYENDNLLATAGDRKRTASPKGAVRADTYSSSDPLPYTSSEALLPPLVDPDERHSASFH